MSLLGQSHLRDIVHSKVWACEWGFKKKTVSSYKKAALLTYTSETHWFQYVLESQSCSFDLWLVLNHSVVWGLGNFEQKKCALRPKLFSKFDTNVRIFSINLNQQTVLSTEKAVVWNQKLLTRVVCKQHFSELRRQVSHARTCQYYSSHVLGWE